MTEYDFLLADRVQKIKQINQEYNLEENAYISFSGGKDSTVLHHLIDIALPDNKIPRIYLNTGIEYKMVVNFVKSLAEKDERFSILPPQQNIREMLENDGYPFKSKNHAKKLHLLQNGSTAPSVLHYWKLDDSEKDKFQVPNKLEYQAKEKLPFKVSDLCCTRMKEQPLLKWAKENNRHIALIGIRQAEGGRRGNTKSCLYFKHNKLRQFYPLLPLGDNFIFDFIKNKSIEICGVYKEPYNFIRTGCKGCPFALHLQEELETIERFFPNERKQCELLFGKVYAEYRRIGFRLKK